MIAVARGKLFSPIKIGLTIAPPITGTAAEVATNWAARAVAYGISQKIADKQAMLLTKSITGLTYAEMRSKELGINKTSDALKQQSLVTSGKVAAIEQVVDQKENKMAMLVGTTAREPDLSHALLEGRPMPIDEALAHIKRWGCKHSIKVL